jgi:hypothetical protein
MAVDIGALVPAVAQGSRWKALLLALWALAVVVFAAESADRLGFGGRPWFGWWDAIVVGTGQPFVVRLTDPHPGGASAAAGIREGDRVDLREQGVDGRARVMWQLSATQPTLLTIHRDGKTVPVRVTGSTIWDGSSSRRVSHILLVVPGAFFLGCALLIIRRRSQTYEGRALAAFLLCLVIAQMTRPAGFAVPDGHLYLLSAVGSGIFSLAAAYIVIRLSSRFGVRFAGRDVVDFVAYAANAIGFLGAAAGCIGVWTMWFDPVPFVMGSFWGLFRIASAVAVAIAAAVAVAASARSEKPRTGWLLLPLPLIFLVISMLDNTVGVQSWFLLWAIIFGASVLSLAGAALVTFALLKRRVLDVGFVLSRSIVVAVLSLAVVAAFVLLEWILGSVVANVSHAEGVAANAGLALVLGLSIRVVHKRVDDLVDAVMFRKRHDDTRALRDFSKEAAFVTERDALLDLAIDKLRRHTDARSAGLFFQENGTYRAVRSFNVAEPIVPENDAAVLALKTWHKPLDPHAYESALRGDLALPMVARGQLLGLLLCGERAGGEAYAPDEIDALAQFAQGLGSAFDGLGSDAPAEQSALLQAIRDLRKSLDRHFAEK